MLGTASPSISAVHMQSNRPVSISHFSTWRVLLALTSAVAFSAVLAFYPFLVYGDLQSYWQSSRIALIWPVGTMASLILLAAILRIVGHLVFSCGRALVVLPNQRLRIRTNLFSKDIALSDVTQVDIEPNGIGDFVVLALKDRSPFKIATALLRESVPRLVQELEKLIED